ncbi:MAG: DUF1292 domain-containing protein [Oscillospiraceae bacterium]|nr:DUF1292 domain-containing protein [Oscillospiraceae bacterium]
MASEEDMDIEQELESEAEIVVFVDENGKEYEFEIIDELCVDGVRYFALLSTAELEEEGDNPQSDELVVAKAVTENGEETFALLEDEDEFAKISKLFTEQLSEFFDVSEDENDCGCGCLDEDGSDCDCCDEDRNEGCDKGCNSCE